jgi:hypothetical protein
LRAGEPNTLRMQVSAAGQPVSDLEPWLGMAGHLIIIAANGSTIAHVHAAGAMAAGQTTRYGPLIEWSYSFPQPGRYRLWMQFQHNGKVSTVPMELLIEP